MQYAITVPSVHGLEKWKTATDMSDDNPPLWKYTIHTIAEFPVIDK